MAPLPASAVILATPAFVTAELVGRFDPEAGAPDGLAELYGSTHTRLYTDTATEGGATGGTWDWDPNRSMHWGRWYPSLITLPDGRLFVARNPQRYDVIILDAFLIDTIPFHLATQEFLQLARSRLAPWKAATERPNASGSPRCARLIVSGSGSCTGSLRNAMLRQSQTVNRGTERRFAT